MNRMSISARFAGALAATFLVAACGGGAASPTPMPPTAPPASAAAPTDSAAATQGATGPASLEALDTVEAGVEIAITWTGPNGEGYELRYVPGQANVAIESIPITVT